MTKKKDIALLVFTKAPIEGQVKTRLIPKLGTEGALLLYKDLVKKTLETAAASDINDIYLYCTPDIKHPYLKFCSDNFEVGLVLQQGHDLGEKMSTAFVEMFAQYNKVLIIGCDCPVITRHDINLATKKLFEGLDVVIGPSEDGGYYLIGMSQTHTLLFQDINWGTSSVLEETRKKIFQLDLESHELPEKWDLDRPEDIYRYFEYKRTY
jgi:uncharacterized protein